ncbi:MAG TPA: FG-GAP-like repeat-containing protein [Candidatus Krumholzibacteria bacterium]|nr:FG-GAP-like repeat-containing protein [Candidatus Krumholzibacteria bacterium]
MRLPSHSRCVRSRADRRRWPVGRTVSTALVLLCAVAAPVAAQLYPRPSTLNSPGGPTAVVVLDVDEDGVFDMVANGPTTGTLTVLRASAPGVFSGRTNIPTPGRRPADVAAGDLDRDGLTDVVWVDGARGDLVVLRQTPGTDDLLFTETVLPGIEEGAAVEVVDRDGDGWLDVVVALRGGDALVWYRNEGGVLVADETLPAGDGPTSLVVLEDPARPVRLALVQTGFLSRDVVLFEAAGGAEVGRWRSEDPRSVVAGDLQDDGVDDLVFVDGIGELRVIDPSGEAATERARVPVEPGTRWGLPLPPAIDRERLAVAEAARGRLTLFEDTGTGFAADRFWYLSVDAADPLRFDVDADGIAELLVPLPTEQAVQVIEPLGDGFLMPRALPTGNAPKRLLVGPEEPGGRRLVALAPTAREAWVYRVVDGELQPLQILPLTGAADEIVLHDADGVDGADLFLLDADEGVFRALSGPDGRFGTLESLIPLAGGLDLAVGNVQDDSGFEIVVADRQLRGLRIYQETGPGVWTEIDARGLPQTPVVLRARDLDGNGYTDLVALGQTDRVILLFGEEAGIDATVSYPVGNEPRDVGFGEFNGDGFDDLVIASAQSSTFDIFSSLAGGFYSSTDAANAAPFGAQNVAVDDVNGDGFDDIVLSSPNASRVSIHFGLGVTGEVIESSQAVRLSETPGDLKLVRIDGDVVPELVTVDRAADMLVFLRSDPFEGLPAVTGTLRSTLAGTEARLEVLADARLADEFGVTRAVDSTPVAVRRVAAGRWVGSDPSPPTVDAEYVLRDAFGNELDRAVTVDEGSATSVDGPGEAIVLPPRVRGRRVTFRFRTGGNHVPGLHVYDLRGRSVRSVEVRAAGGGWFESTWDGRDARGQRLARGRYVVRIRGPERTMATSVLLR